MLHRATRRDSSLAVAAITTAALIALAGCSEPSSSPTTRPAPTPLSGCTGTAGPTFTGKATSWDAPVTTSDQSAVATDVSAPVLSPAPAEQSRYRIASVHVSARVVQNGSYVVAPGSLVLLDPAGKICPRPATNPLPQTLDLTTIDETKGADGNVAFLVPANATLADYSVVYVAQPTDRTALAQWSGKGTAPSRTVTDACAGQRTTYDRSTAPTARFGAAGSSISDDIGTVAIAQQPVGRKLAPSSSVPGNVQGLAVDLAVTARGADAYIDRRQFVLLDGGGRACGFGNVPSPGENLTSALIKAGSTARYTLIFWAPTGATLSSFTLLQLTEPTSKKVAAAWATTPKP